MSDLSKMLGDVYGTTTIERAPGQPTGDPADERFEEPVDMEPDERAEDEVGQSADDATLPDWADEDVLDRAFATWVPGPSSDAPAAERDALAEDPGAEPEPVRAAEPEPVRATEPELVAKPEPVRATEPSGWSRRSDDILPGRGRRRRR